IIQWATTPEERSVIATLEELPVLATAAGIGPPATPIVGAVVSIPAEAAALATPLAELDPRSITRRGTDRGSGAPLRV
ncbi:MAG: hypothetical protein M3P43_12470, partial [Actinomycetota bacterium]|nr:hypothetical protein [Actinomycetota bacterium]